VCGITGFTHIDESPDPERIRMATMSLVHRGPDQQGVYQNGFVSLGAVRLKIIDLDGGQQPMSSDDGGTVIVFNGEIYNHEELRRELERRGHRFHSRCDTEVVLRAFEEWDKDCFSKLRGMFGVALWTASQRRLVLARDRMGIKPLYYARRNRDVFFGSELKAILEHPEIDRRLDIEGLHYYLSLNYVPSPHTLVAGIKKLPPGCWLEWQDGEMEIGQWWRLRLEPDRRRSLESAKEELDSLLKASIREHLISDVPLGIWASGGLDSSTILHYAAEATSSRLNTFSVSFRGRSFDETPYFREIARKYAVDAHELDLNPDADLEGAIRQFAYYSDEPSADAGALPVWFLSQMSRQYVTVALSGEGADELFGGYCTYLADNLVRPLRVVPKGLRRLSRTLADLLFAVSDDKVSFEYKLKRFLEGSMLSPAEAHLFWNGSCSAEQKFRLCGLNGEYPKLGTLMPAEAAGCGSINRFLWLDQLYYLPDDILYKCDRMSMAHSLEVRPPFLDHRIVEFAAGLPEHFKIRGSKLKFVLRELMRDKLPDSVLRRSKQGFDIPAHDWFRGPLLPLLSETLTPQAVKETGLFRWSAIDALIRSHTQRHANLGYQLWGLLTLFLWMKQWRIQAGQEYSQASEEFSVVTS
jgi:asparagine synthase (glutamine-hydrolysing)